MDVIRIQAAFARLKPVVFWTLAITMSALPILAQKGAPRGGGSGSSRGSPGGATPNRPVFVPGQPGTQPNAEPSLIVPPEPLPKPVVAEDESCLPWALADVRGATVSATRLAVPTKARSQYEKACGAFKKKKWTEAEQHVRDAIQMYSKYPAAWVMLGQILQGERKMDEAHDACSKVLTVDPTYLPPYLCLAGLLNLEGNWEDLQTWADQFLGKNPVGDVYAYYYRGLALFHLRDLPGAQKSVLQAIASDSAHRQPAFNFLLAQIYGEQGDLVNATLQVQQFVKFSNSRQDKDSAREYLSQLKSQLSAQ
jgi:tetratricopeptide (TPR) repeat protein